MLRRFEAYAIDPDADGDAVTALERACRDCGRFIPEVLDSCVGWNLSNAPVHLVWEHAYTFAEAYRRYMVHPYHAEEIDRFLLADSPERVVVDDRLGAGLFGYVCDRPAYRLAGGVRRLVLLATAPGTGEGEVAALREELGRAAEQVPEMTVSVIAANTLAQRWFDGETAIGPTAHWTHLWEQGFTSLDDLAGYLARAGVGGEPEVSGARWRAVVARSATLHYEISRGGEAVDDVCRAPRSGEPRLLEHTTGRDVVGEHVRRDAADAGLAEEPGAERPDHLGAVALPPKRRRQAVADLQGAQLVEPTVGVPQSPMTTPSSITIPAPGRCARRGTARPPRPP